MPYVSRLIIAIMKALYIGPKPVVQLRAEHLKSSDPARPNEPEFPLVAVAFGATCVCIFASILV